MPALNLVLTDLLCWQYPAMDRVFWNRIFGYNSSSLFTQWMPFMLSNGVKYLREQNVSGVKRGSTAWMVTMPHCYHSCLH